MQNRAILLQCDRPLKAGATQTETLLLKQYVVGDCVDLLDDHSLVFLQVF